MPSNYTPSNRLDLQQTGENLNTWGARLNDGAFNPIDFSLDGVVVISASGATTLTTANGEPDQARGRVLNVTATAAATITIPSVSKLYVVRAANAAVTITNGSNSLTLASGSVSWIVTDGTSIWAVRVTDLGGARLQNVGAPLNNSDACTKFYADSLALDAAAGNLPGQIGNAGKYLRTNGSQPAWEAVAAADVAGIDDLVAAAAAAAVTKSAVESAVGGPVALLSDTFVTITGATHTFAAADNGKVHRFTSGTAVTATIPNSLPAGWNIVWRQLGAGQVTFATGAGAIRRNRYGHSKSSGQYAEGALSVDENVGGTAAVYVFSGDTAA